MDKKILKQLKSDYEELEIKPSTDLWDQIDSALEKEPESLPKPAASWGWWKYAAAVLLLISVGTLIYYNRKFNTEKTDYFVKQNIEKTVFKTENNPEIIPRKENPIVEIAPKIIKETDQKVKQNHNKNLLSQKEIFKPQVLEPLEPKVVINQPENKIERQENIENKITPVISDSKKISYVTANDLLLGNELDKSREKANTDTRKFGVIHLNKVLPKFNNVVVLGATVYVDPR
jgi:hypothetical protein